MKRLLAVLLLVLSLPAEGTMTCSNYLLRSVKEHEGLREKSYRDSEGVLTIGYGTNIERWGIPEKHAETMAVTDYCAECWLHLDLEESRTALARNYPWAIRMAPARVDALVEMTYNLGINGLSRFRKMLFALFNGNWIEAEEEALDSIWARQVGIRAHRLAQQLRTGEYWNDDEQC